MNKRFGRFAFINPIVVIGLGAALIVTACQQPNVETPNPDSHSDSPTENSVTQPGQQVMQTPVISAAGVGPIKVGMTVEEAEAASGIDLAGFGDDTQPASCRYVKPVDEFPELSFMTTDGVITRLDVSSYRIVSDAQSPEVEEIESTLFTQNRITTGSSQSAVEAAYPNAEKTPHKYVPDGYYLTVDATESSDSVIMKLIFETDGTEVTRIRGGQSPEVDFVEGCA